MYVLAILLVALFAVGSLLLLPPRLKWLDLPKNRRAVSWAALVALGLSTLLYFSPGADLPAPRPAASESAGAETAEASGESSPVPATGEPGSPTAGGQEPGATPIPMPGDGLPSRGGWQGTKYVSAFASIVFEPPASWEHFNDDQLGARFGFDPRMLPEQGSAFPAEVPMGSVIFDMQGFDPETGSNVIVRFHRYQGELEGYMTQLRDGLKNMDTLEYEIDDEITQAVLAGQSFMTFATRVKNLNAVQLYLGRELNGYIMLVNVMTVGDVTPEDVKVYFRAKSTGDSAPQAPAATPEATATAAALELEPAESLAPASVA